MIHRLIKLVNFTAQKKDVIIDGKKSVAWGQCAGVVGDRRALGVGHRGKAAAGGSGARGFDWNIYKLNNIIAAAPGWWGCMG